MRVFHKMNLRVRAENMVGRRAPNMRVLSSYWVAQDATHKYFEVICIDPEHNAIRNDARMNWICKAVHKRRETRGLTSAGRKHRGLETKGHRANRLRPSVRGHWKHQNTLSLRRYKKNGSRRSRG